MCLSNLSASFLEKECTRLKWEVELLHTEIERLIEENKQIITAAETVLRRLDRLG